MKTIIGLAMAFILTIGISSVTTYAYFNDMETSTGNQLTAGYLDLKTDDADGVTQTLYATSMEPGDIAGPEEIELKNAGNIDGKTLDMVFTYRESDAKVNPVDRDPDETAAVIELTTLNYDGTNLLITLVDLNFNTYVDIHDLKNSDLSGQGGIRAEEVNKFEITVQLRSDTDNDFQADGITMNMTFTLNQAD